MVAYDKSHTLGSLSHPLSNSQYPAYYASMKLLHGNAICWKHLPIWSSPRLKWMDLCSAKELQLIVRLYFSAMIDNISWLEWGGPSLHTIDLFGVGARGIYGREFYCSLWQVIRGNCGVPKCTACFSIRKNSSVCGKSWPVGKGEKKWEKLPLNFHESIRPCG